MDKKTVFRRVFVDGICLCAGSVCFGIAVSVFVSPAAIAPGGITGLAILLKHLIGMPAGVGTLLLNLPLLFLAWRYLGTPFFIRTTIGLTVSSLCIDMFAAYLPPFADDRLLAALFGGVLTGAGLGLIYLRGGSSGGAEILALFLRRKFPHLSIGNLILLIDAAVILLSVFVFGQIESALYAAVTVFLTAQVMDRLVYGGQTAKFAVIVSEKGTEVAQAVFADLMRGVTVLEAAGGYTGKKQQLLICAVGRAQAHLLRAVIARVDPHAFVIFATADEIFGEGFSVGGH